MPKTIKRKVGKRQYIEFDIEIATLIANGMRSHAKAIHSYPNGFGTLKSWKAYVNQIAKDIEAFVDGEFTDYKKEMKAQVKAHEAIKRFAQMWPAFWV